MIDPISLEVLWNRLVSIVDEQAAALIHASFTTVVREAGDLSAGVFDAQGRMLAQAVTGTPGHINTMANCVRDHVVPAFPLEALEPGDTLITNDPWAASGHLFDLTIVSPVYRGGRGIGWFASTCHATDIGGLTMGADASEVFEEGLAIPLLKLFERGEPNHDLFEIIRANVRVPDLVIGDIHAQQAGNIVGSRKLVEMLDDCEIDDLETLGPLILDRTEHAVRESIRQIPNGEYRSEVSIDGFDDPPDDPLPNHDRRLRHLRGLLRQLASSRPWHQRRAQLHPGLLYVHPHGGHRASHSQQRGGFFVRCTSPPPPARSSTVVVRPRWEPVTSSGTSCRSRSSGLSRARYRSVSSPTAQLACGTPCWRGRTDEEGHLFAYIYFSAGGMGARPQQDGLSATAFPSGITGVPAEVIEAVAPIMMHKRELVTDSGGAGRFRGGLGQEMELEVVTGYPAVHSPMYDRTVFPARGFMGGCPGAVGAVRTGDGRALHPKTRYTLAPGERVVLRLPGGGGFHPPYEREVESVLDDVLQGYVSKEAAEESYGVVIDAESWTVDVAATERRRTTLRQRT